MTPQEITLTITTDETNLILEALGNLPFVKVYALIGKIQNQASAQLSSNSRARGEIQAEPPATVLNE